MLKAITPLFLLPTLLPAQINVAFHNGQTTLNAMGTRPDGTVVKTSTDTWNNPTNNDGEGLAFTDFALLDRSGAATTATLDSSSGFSTWNRNGWAGETQDHVMMEGWFGFRGTEAITVNNLPASYSSGGYSIVIYGDSKVAGRAMNYTVNDGITTSSRTIVDDLVFNGTFTEDVDFVTFTGLSGSSFTITGNPGAADARSAVNGFIIIPGVLPTPPEITSFAADDHYVDPGTTVTLDWAVTGADSLTLDPGGIDVTGLTSTALAVTDTTTFTLTAENGDGTDVATIRVGAGPPRPNIVFFLVDDMGWQDTSEPFLHDAAGNEVVTPLNNRYRTPSMELLADRGMKFTNAYAMPVCTPTRNCWITGLNSVRHHVTNWTNPAGTDTDQNSTTSHNGPGGWIKGGLPSSHPTLPGLLQGVGYRTIHAGKAHFGATTHAKEPLNFGFDINIAGSEIGHPGSYSGDYGQSSNRPVPDLEDYHNTGTHLSEALTLEMNKAIEAAVDDGVPFFAYMAHYAVHSPFQTDPRFSANYPTLSGGQLAYATLIEGMDKSLGDIMTKLEALGIAEDTFIVFMSDNGGDAPMPSVNESNAPLRHKKGSKYEGGVREPFIAGWARPDATNPFQAVLPVPAGSREDDLIAVFDLFPTFAALAGATFTHDIDGHDLTPYFAATPGTHRPQELLIHYPHDHRSDYFTILREGDWKLIYNFATDSYELYNLATDLSETTDLSGTEPERVMTMARKMARQLSEAGAQWPRFAAGGDDPFAVPSLPTVDVDNDGIPDNTEDPNGNGLVDPGETDPDSDNTDGDETPDGAELKTGTDPLDPLSYFRITGIGSDPANHILLTWPSAPGASYRVEYFTAVLGAWTRIEDNIPAAPGATETTYDTGPQPTDPAALYRVILE